MFNLTLTDIICIVLGAIAGAFLAILIAAEFTDV